MLWTDETTLGALSEVVIKIKTSLGEREIHSLRLNPAISLSSVQSTLSQLSVFLNMFNRQINIREMDADIALHG
jgi:hypothetical protein